MYFFFWYRMCLFIPMDLEIDAQCLIRAQGRSSSPGPRSEVTLLNGEIAGHLLILWKIRI
ncbi:hypothetical protein NQ317_004408 [Molorchus minor]|uniref:Uncharacterized protein n=1 Tax=Molorchus minor TaxID=1323400 RepID=A0ABQ9JBI0_9CUCU|nr:hypothetical protein NQ317_004408 [Molorchus minor]